VVRRRGICKYMHRVVQSHQRTTKPLEHAGAIERLTESDGGGYLEIVLRWSAAQHWRIGAHGFLAGAVAWLGQATNGEQWRPCKAGVTAVVCAFA
jgi:hypothetical protein